LGRILEDDGYHVVIFTDPVAALESVTRNEFDLIIVDIRMPELDGFEFLRRVRAHDPEARVILVTGFASRESALIAETARANDYLVKPFSIGQLQASITRTLARRLEQASPSELDEDEIMARPLAALQALYDAGRALSTTKNLNELLNNILRLAMGVTQARIGSIMLLDDARRSLTIAAAQGLEQTVIGEVRVPIGESIAGHVAQTGESLLIENVESDPRFHRRSHERYGGASLICTPLKVGDSLLGVINLANREGGGAFLQADLRLLTTLASQAAVAIDDARQFARTARQLREFKGLHELATAMPAIKTIEEMRRKLFDTLSRVITVDYCVWLGCDADAGVISIVSTQGDNLRLSDTGKLYVDRKRYSRPQIENVKIAALPLHSPEELSAVVRGFLVRLGVRSAGQGAFMVIPLTRDGVIESLVCLGSDSEAGYDEHHRSIVTIVVSQAAVMYEKEKSLVNASRALTMGNMISEIAHDLRKPLTTIRGSLGLLKGAMRKGEDTTDLFRLLEEETLRLNELVSELVDFSKPTRYDTEKTDLRRLVMRGLELVSEDLEKRGIATRTSFGDANWEVIINKNQALEAILNLVMNATDAMPNGGELSVEGAVGRPDFKTGDYLALSISDTGEGISRDHLPKVFSRYFTTKSTGTGLGLAAVERIMSAHNGTVTVRSEIGKGTTFTLYFPLTLSS